MCCLEIFYHHGQSFFFLEAHGLVHGGVCWVIWGGVCIGDIVGGVAYIEGVESGFNCTGEIVGGVTCVEAVEFRDGAQVDVVVVGWVWRCS